VVVISFAALAFLLRRTVLAVRAAGRPLPLVLQRVLLSPVLRVALGAVSVFVLVFLWLGALVGKNNSGVNLTPTFVYVYFWIFTPILSAVLGNVWSVLSPWKAAAEGVGWLARRKRPPFEYPERLGRWPAAVRHGPPGAPLGYKGPPPEECERRERDHEHAGCAVEEDVPWDREVANPPDPVGEDPAHLTVSCPILISWLSVMCSSISKTPLILATNGILTATVPLRTGFSMS
jgi:hypothetical protein